MASNRLVVEHFWILIVFLPTMSTHQVFKRVCYLRVDPEFPFESFIRLDLCTHLIIGFIIIDPEPTPLLKLDPTTASFLKLCRKTIDEHGSKIHLMFSIGGVKEIGWSQATSTDAKRKNLAQSIVQFIRAFNLDGVDLDWEFPAFPQAITRSSERTQFSQLLRAIREELNRLETVLQKHLILSVAVAGQMVIIHSSYQPSEIAKYVDFINLMTYDFYIHKWYWPFIGHNSALHARTLDIGPIRTFNVEWAANHWHRKGVAKQQIVVGMPTYAKRYILYSKMLKYPGMVAYKGEEDMNYTQVCAFLRRPGTVQRFDLEAKVPYAQNGYEWISYENEFSAMHKTHWIRKNHFGGIMLFSLNADDFRFGCGSSSNRQMFPIHSTVRDTLLGLEMREI